MATTVNLGSFYDSFCGGSYTCYLIYDTPTRNGDNVTITNVKARIVSQQSWGTEGRIGVSLTIAGSSVVSNTQLAASYSYPTDTTVTLTSSRTFSNLPSSFSYSISFSDTGYGTGWNDSRSFTKSGSISCPARTYSVSYNANGGSGAPSAQTKTYNVALTLSSTIPTRSGYAFLGWATSSTGSVAYAAGSSYTGNAALSLYAIWQAQESQIDSVADKTLGTACSVKWTPNLASFKFKVKFSIGTWSYTTDYITPNTTSQYTYTSYTIPIVDSGGTTGPAFQITSAATGTMTATLYTYDSSNTLLGTATKDFTVTVPASCAPTCTASISQTSSSSVVNGWGIYVAGYSKARCQASGTPKYGASIVSVQLTGSASSNAGSSMDYTTEILTAGTKTFTFTVTDSRGMTSASVSKTATVVAYSAPEITSFTAERDASSVTTVKALATWTYSNIGSNTITKSLQYRASTTSTWSNAAGTAIASGTVKTMSEVFTDSVSYYIRLTITDSLSNASTLTVYVPTINIWMHMPVNGQGVAFGKAAETGGFEVNYPAEFYQDVHSVGTHLGLGSVEYIKGTQTASTNAWTGVTKESALYDGKMIMYVLPYAGTSTGATLNLTLAGGGTTGAKSIYRYGGTTAVTTHYAAGSRILMVYDSSNSRWNCSAYYNSNTTYSTLTQALVNTGTETTGKLITAKIVHDSIRDLVYPVGSIYMSVNSTSPATFIGGTWEQIQDTFLLSAGSTYTAGDTGGAASVALAEGNLPSHRHGYPRAVGMYGTTSETGIGVQIGFYNNGASDGLFFSDRFSDTNKRYTSYTGSGTAHNNMPPYLVVYMWKRTA